MVFVYNSNIIYSNFLDNNFQLIMVNIDEVKILLSIIKKLQGKYNNRKFTLDGRLIGDLGEIIVEQNYKIRLFEKQEKMYDGYSNSKKVQIKATFKDKLTFPYGKDNIPDYYLGIKLNENGSFEEIYNGPGINIYELLKNRKRPNNGYFSISISTLKAENKKILDKDRIKRRI